MVHLHVLISSCKPHDQGTKHLDKHPVLKNRVPHGSQPRHGWAPDPPMVGIRSPIGLVVESCTSHPGVLGSIPKREEPGKTGAPCVKVPGSSRVPAPPWWAPDPPMVGIRSPIGLVVGSCTSHPGVLGSIQGITWREGSFFDNQ